MQFISRRLKTTHITDITFTICHPNLSLLSILTMDNLRRREAQVLKCQCAFRDALSHQQRLLICHEYYVTLGHFIHFTHTQHNIYHILTSRATTWPELHPLPKSTKIDFAVRFRDISDRIILRHVQKTYYYWHVNKYERFNTQMHSAISLKHYFHHALLSIVFLPPITSYDDAGNGGDCREHGPTLAESTAYDVSRVSLRACGLHRCAISIHKSSNYIFITPRWLSQ